MNLNTFSIDKKSYSSVFDIDMSKLNCSTFPIKNDEIDKIHFSVNVNRNLVAPVEQGTVIGNIDVYTDSTDLACIPLSVSTAIDKNRVKDYFYYFFKSFNTLISSTY